MTARRPVRVLMTADAVGGVWTYATELAAGLPEHGWEVLLAVLGPEPDDQQRRAVEALPGVTLLPTGLPLDWLGDAAAARQAGQAVAEMARRQRADLVHLNSPALAAEARFPVPVVGVAHGCLGTWWEAAKDEPLAAEFRWHSAAMAQALRAMDLALAPSESFAATLQRHYALPVHPGVVRNGRDFTVPSQRGEPEQAAITVGRLWDPVKNALLLDEAAARLSVPFVAAGTTVGPHGEAVSLRHLHALGHIGEDDLAARLARQPVFASAARFEPFGLAVLEAASAGCALVLSDIATFRELWDDAAVFVPPDDAVAYASAIDRLLTDALLRAKLGAAARERSMRYSAAAMVTGMAGHYRALLGRRAAA